MNQLSIFKWPVLFSTPKTFCNSWLFHKFKRVHFHRMVSKTYTSGLYAIVEFDYFANTFVYIITGSYNFEYYYFYYYYCNILFIFASSRLEKKLINTIITLTTYAIIHIAEKFTFSPLFVQNIVPVNFLFFF